MAIKLIANYSKRLGLPGYSSHQFSVSVETELVTTDDVAAESERLYQRLQSTVDEQILHTGFVPPADYGMDPPADSTKSVTSRDNPTNVTQVASWQRGPAWKCSDKQKDLILKLVEEHRLDKADIEALAVERFGKGVRLLNKVEASGLIDEMLETYGGGQRHDQGKRGDNSAYSGNRKGRAA
ncbi:MAG: hypothetical protein ABIS50_23655 [Luteolibacter sp.]|uniref:hypothetical protein n=1 Tax=Luteolibacter sp. TaxID=1962973 RepID=UPI003267930E